MSGVFRAESFHAQGADAGGRVVAYGQEPGEGVMQILVGATFAKPGEAEERIRSARSQHFAERHRLLKIRDSLTGFDVLVHREGVGLGG